MPFEIFIEKGFTKEKNVGQLWKETDMVSSFPLTDQALRMAIERVIHFDTEQGMIPVNYDDLILNIHSKIKSLPNPTVETVSKQKAGSATNSEEYEYTLLINYKDCTYKINPGDYGDYFDSHSVMNIMNYILNDFNKQERLISMRTDDQGTTYIFANPSDLIELYEKFNLELNVEIK